MSQDFVAVEATEERYRALQHQPSGAGFEENGRGLWPADQFTFRLRDEGAIRIVEPGSAPAPAPPPILPESSGSAARRRA